MRRLPVVGVLAVVLTIAGCGGGGGPTRQPAAHTTSSATSTTSETTSTEPAVAGDSCGLMFLRGSAVLLSRSWNRVTHSRGRDDHEKWVKEFTEKVDDLIDDVKDEPTVQARAACGLIELHDLAVQAAILDAYLVASDDEGSDENYEKLADAGNDWLQKVEVADEVDAFQATFTG